MSNTIKVAIDGPSGAGKSTIAKAASAALGFVYVDTGALYRTVALNASLKNADFKNSEQVIASLEGLEVSLGFVDGAQHVYLNGEDVSDEIRTPEISMGASAVSAIPAVRKFLFNLQRDIADKNNCIMDGRDIGTVVLPDAQVKIFLTASPEIRAERRCKELLEKGIQTLVVPGNHDIDTHVAYRYEGEEAFPIASPTVKEFRNLYFPFGLEQSFQRMDGAFSYAYQAAEDLVVLAVDGNFSRYYEVGKEGLAFVEDVLKKAKHEGKKVLPFSHQSALLHNERFQTNYAMNDHDALSALYREYDVSLSLAGHWHIQHIQDGDGFDEILTSPLCLLENSYAILKYEDGAFSYSKKRLDMASYAKRHGLEDPIYLDFQQASYDFFEKIGKRGFSPENIPEGMEEEDYLAIWNAFLHFNRSYFIGEKVDLSLYQEEISLFEKYPNYLLCSYMSSILSEFENDDRVYPN